MPKMINFTRKKEKQIIPLKVRLPSVEKIAIVESLAIMLASGIPILEALDSIEEDSTSLNTKGVIDAIRDSAQKGNSLADSFSQFPKVFDDIFINTVKAGEESGSLDKVLKQLSDNLRQTEQIKADVRNAMLYPAIVLAVLLFVLVILLGFVVPKVAEVFNRLSIPKPLPTKILLSTASFLNQNYIFVLVILATIAILASILLSKKEIRRKIYTISFRIPLIGIILKYLDLSRFSGTLSLLLSAGIPIIRAVEASSSVMINQKTKLQIAEITHELTEGKSLAESMRKYKSFPTLMTRLISTGEKTGSLDKVLAEVSSHYHTKLSRQVKTLSTTLEPILIIIIGVIVGAVIIAIISPIYQLIGQIQPR